MLPECLGVSAVPGEQQQERGAPDGKWPGVAGAKDGWRVCEVGHEWRATHVVRAMREPTKDQEPSTWLF